MPKSQPRPSREERRVQQQVTKARDRVDKRYRTRSGKALEERLTKIETGHPGTLRRLAEDTRKNTPPTAVAGQNIYSGKWRGFEANFQRDWWRKQKQPWTCYLCGRPIVAGARDRDAPSIEHKEPWARAKLGIATRTVCCNGSHWEVALTDDVRAVLQDENNLLPAHKGCNSAKNGPKDTDSIAPRRLGDCPGPGLCKERKAT